MYCQPSHASYILIISSCFILHYCSTVVTNPSLVRQRQHKPSSHIHHAIRTMADKIYTIPIPPAAALLGQLAFTPSTAIYLSALALKDLTLVSFVLYTTTLIHTSAACLHHTLHTYIQEYLLTPASSHDSPPCCWCYCCNDFDADDDDQCPHAIHGDDGPFDVLLWPLTALRAPLALLLKVYNTKLWYWLAVQLPFWVVCTALWNSHCAVATLYYVLLAMVRFAPDLLGGTLDFVGNARAASCWGSWGFAVVGWWVVAMAFEGLVGSENVRVRWVGLEAALPVRGELVAVEIPDQPEVWFDAQERMDGEGCDVEELARTDCHEACGCEIESPADRGEPSMASDAGLEDDYVHVEHGGDLTRQ